VNDFPRQKLTELIGQYGHSLCSDPRRCEGLLRDCCGDYRREVFILITALKDGIAEDLQSLSSRVPNEMLLLRLTKRLQNNSALTEDAAQWAVESWALALGILTEAKEKLGMTLSETQPLKRKKFRRTKQTSLQSSMSSSNPSLSAKAKSTHPPKQISAAVQVPKANTTMSISNILLKKIKIKSRAFLRRFLFFALILGSLFGLGGGCIAIIGKHSFGEVLKSFGISTVTGVMVAFFILLPTILMPDE
jgi:hypothetical protein